MSSELTPRAIFVLQVAKTMDCEAFTSMFHTAAQKKPSMITQDQTNFQTKADWFCKNTAEGLAQASLSRINQLIEAFFYCVLGAHVNIRSSILGSGGCAKEVQTEFLVLVEDAIRQPDLSVQKYHQLAVDEAKVRLNLAVCPHACLLKTS